MRAIALVGLLILSSFSAAANWQPQTGDSETIGLINGDIESIPIDQFPHTKYDGYWILSRDYPVPSDWVTDLKDEGIECWSFLPSSSFHCELNNHTPDELAELGVTGMVRLPAESKLHPHIMPSLRGEMQSWFIAENIGVVNVVLSGDSLSLIHI